MRQNAIYLKKHTHIYSKKQLKEPILNFSLRDMERIVSKIDFL